MPSVAPCDFPLAKSLQNLKVSVTYIPVPGDNEKLDCTVDFLNTSVRSTDLPSDTASNVEDDHEAVDGTVSDDDIEATERHQLTDSSSNDVSLFLGYIQMVGYVRLNNDFNGTGGSSAKDVFWKNHEFATKYPTEDEHDKVEAILQTPFFNENDALCHFKTKLAGWPDFRAGSIDAAGLYLLHDLAFAFNSKEPPKIESAGISAQESHFFVSELPQCIVPFYVTSQHLLFSSTRIKAGERETHKLRLSIPSKSLPPSYNTRLTGFLGDNGLVSICYKFIVGLLDETDQGMIPRSIYFPLEFTPGQIRTERGWSQANFLQQPIVDKDWQPRAIEADADHCRSNGKTTERNSEVKKKAAKAKLEAELANLINSSVETVAAKERRKSSVSLKKDDHGYIPQIPSKTRLSYQIMVNGQHLCQALVSKASYRVGEDVHFCLSLPSTHSLATRVVGVVTHIEAHEVFHLVEQRKLVNIYKVTPSIKVNTYASALAITAENEHNSVCSMINLPLLLTQQFQASTLMDLRYFLVFSLVLNEFDEQNHIACLDQDDERAVAEYLHEYQAESEFHKFRFSIPLVVLP